MRWLDRLRLINPGASLGRLAFWRVLQTFTWLYVFMLYGHRCWGVRNIPRSGPVLLVSNHQSYIDPIVLGAGIHHRHLHPMARRTLFSNPIFGWLIRMLNAFEVDQSRSDLKAIRTAIQRLKQGHILLVYPEGQRTPDGTLQPFQPGTMMLIRRAKPAVVPMAVEGVYDVWPSWRSRPRWRGRVAAMYGEPIPPERLIGMKPEDARALLEERIERLRLDLRAKLRRQTHGRYPPPGPGDESAV